MIKDLLLIIDNAERAAPIVRTAVAMATRLDAGLTVQILTPNPILSPGVNAGRIPGQRGGAKAGQC